LFKEKREESKIFLRVQKAHVDLQRRMRSKVKWFTILLT